MAHPGPAYLVALAETLVVEVPVYAVSLHCARLLVLRRAVAVAVLANLLTHPVVWLVLIHGGPSGYRFGLAEIGAVLVEAAVCWLLVRRELALIVLVALVANTASVVVGSGVGQIVGGGR